MATMPRAIPVEVWLETDIDTARHEVPPVLGVMEPVRRRVLLKGSTDDLDWYARELMRLPFTFDVQAPQALAAALGRLAGALARQFTR